MEDNGTTTHGQGVCVSFSASWDPGHHSLRHPGHHLAAQRQTQSLSFGVS